MVVVFLKTEAKRAVVNEFELMKTDTLLGGKRSAVAGKNNLCSYDAIKVQFCNY